MTSRAANTLLAMALAVLGSVGVTGVAHASPRTLVMPQVTAAYSAAACGDTSGFTQADLSSLPPEATDTVNLIKAGGPYPYPQDDGVFSNREDILPACASGYYREYTVETPGSHDRGARRFVTGEGGEFFYTNDHYASFDIVDVNA